MKSIFTVAAMAMIFAFTGCSTPKKVETLEGRGARQVFGASLDQVWQAALAAADMEGLHMVSNNRESGYIAARRGIRLHSFGEHVGIWVKQLSTSETEVAVVSRQAGPPVAWLKNWENEILRAISANLSREGASDTRRNPR